MQRHKYKLPPSQQNPRGLFAWGKPKGIYAIRTADLHLQRSTETLLGYLQGITCDDHLSDLEIAKLQGWLETHHALRQHYPFDEITARVESILQDSVIDEEERAELLEWCADLSLDNHPAYELIDMATRQLHGVLHGIQSDGKVTEEEVYGLRDWLEHFRIFRGAWPFSEAFALVDHILEDNQVSAKELTQLHAFCNHFAERPTDQRPSAPTSAMRWKPSTSVTP